jgi:hypothetical protein
MPRRSATISEKGAPAFSTGANVKYHAPIL